MCNFTPQPRRRAGGVFLQEAEVVVLSDANRVKCWEAMLRGELPNGTAKNTETWTAPKGDIRSLINAADDFADTNANAYNTAIPVGIRSKFTSKQKALALGIVCLKRAGVL